jgi:hypothetical protein
MALDEQAAQVVVQVLEELTNLMKQTILIRVFEEGVLEVLGR